MDKQKKPILSFRADELAVPEVCTGEVPDTGELAEAPEEEEIQYDTLAVPEVHFCRKKPRE